MRRNFLHYLALKPIIESVRAARGDQHIFESFQLKDYDIRELIDIDLLGNLTMGLAVLTVPSIHSIQNFR